MTELIAPTEQPTCRGAHPEAIKRHLGHSRIKVTMDVYGHLFPSEADNLAPALDDLYRDSVTDKTRTNRRIAPEPGKAWDRKPL